MPRRRSSRVSNRIADDARRYQVRVFRYTQATQGEVRRRLSGVRADLVALVADGDPTGPTRRGDQLNRVDALATEARSRVARRYRDIASDVADRSAQAAVVDQSIMAQIVSEVAGVPALQTIPTRMLDRIVDRAIIDGAPSSEWWRRQAGDVAQRFHDELRQGVQAGESVGDLIKRVRGTPEKQYADGIMRIPQANAEALVRSSQLSILHDTRMAEFRQNADIVEGWAILATFDDRTCAICMGLSGAAFDMDGNPLDGSPFGERLTSDGLPLHFSCRCVAVPVLQGEGLPTDLGFEDWLSAQPEADQQDILGPEWWAAWNAGELTDLRSRIDQKGRPITLKELRGEPQRRAA